jgi:GT2 family glycosyltransferase
MKVGIVTPIRQVHYITQHYIESLFASQWDIDNVHLILIDNGGKTTTLAGTTFNDYFEVPPNNYRANIFHFKQDPEKSYVESNNIGLKYCLESNYEFIGILSNDLMLQQSTIERITSIADKNRNALIQPKLEHGEDFRKILEQNMYTPDFSENIVVDNHLCGPFFLGHRSVYENVGMFNNDLKLQFMEFDYYNRLKQNGYITMRHRNVFVYHHGSATIIDRYGKPDNHPKYNDREVYEKLWGPPIYAAYLG